jgi:tRNA U34 5-methylaminomethyl-2-thiouridine-forming methyltransferase MnmC
VPIDPAAPAGPGRDDPALDGSAVGPEPRDWADALLITADGSRTLRSARYGEAFRSHHGAHAEARHVFVEGTGAGARLAAGLATRVLEVGLGAATNLAWTVAAALEGGADLHYEVWEPDPLPAAAWAVLRHDEVLPAAAWASLLAARAGWGRPGPGSVHVWRFGRVGVEVIAAPIAAMLDDAARASADVDAVYLDPFSPAVNPDAWTPAVLRGLARRLRPGGVLASYSVAGAVRRALTAAGMEVARVPGPEGGKREVLRARRRPAAVDDEDDAAGGNSTEGGAR